MLIISFSQILLVWGIALIYFVNAVSEFSSPRIVEELGEVTAIFIFEYVFAIWIGAFFICWQFVLNVFSYKMVKKFIRK